MMILDKFLEMDEIIKEVKIGRNIYQVGYNIFEDKIFLRLDICKDYKYLILLIKWIVYPFEKIFSFLCYCWENIFFEGMQDMLYELGHLEKEKIIIANIWNVKTQEGTIFFLNDDMDVETIYVNNIKEMIEKLKEYHEIPEEIEKEYENLFILYKLNDFNKI